MFDKKYLLTSFGFTLFLFVLYLLFHTITESIFILSPVIVLAVLLLIDIIGAILKTKLDLKSVVNYVLIYGCLTYGLTLFLLIYDFSTISMFITLVSCLVGGSLFSLIFYPANKEIHITLSHINTK